MMSSGIFVLLIFVWFSISIGGTSGNVTCDECEYNPLSPLVMCKNLPLDFLNCSEPLDLGGNETKRKELGYGCTKYGGERYEDVQKTGVVCDVLPDIECFGNKTFIREGFPCIKYNGHYFVTTLIYSVLLGFLGMDRFCLGHTGTAVGKLLTLGGVGIWWIVDIILLVNGILLPEDGSNWVPYY
ncbi:TM2 domain-containing protein CG11103-like [Ylistrum balloti]|uniref:TM2 domain-containing protein CG11103-like n=1 Tax=Ylistrum balloti TaxID=509963 RepID=UPI0029059954|nr:TM2 domain-containing protein CG11103-like [Ylistrum balloti]